jgi:creatinine amidohydrolase
VTKRNPTRRGVLANSVAAVTAGTFCGAARAAAAPAGNESFVDPRRVLLWEITRRDFREAIEGGALKAVIVPTGSTEQHFEHLAMIQDTASSTLVAQQAALRLHPQVLVTTPVAIGISPHWMDRKGTLSLKKETFLAVVFDICDSLRAHGVDRILVLNGHGGNVAPLRDNVPEMARKLGIRVEAASYWEAYTPEIVKRYMESGHVPGHAGEFETSFAMAAFPERVHWESLDPAYVETLMTRRKDLAFLKNEESWHRGARLATAAKGEAMIGIAVAWTAERVRQLIQRT